MARRLPLTPENFPSVFTVIPPEQLREFPAIPITELKPNRYYLYIDQIDSIYIIYVCNNSPRTRNIVVRYVYQYLTPFGWIALNREAWRTMYVSFGHEREKWYDLATGFDGPNGRIQLNPDSVELLNCDLRMRRGGGQHSKKCSTRRYAKNKRKTRRRN